MRKFKLLKDFIHPSFVIRAGVIKNADEWFWNVFYRDYYDPDISTNREGLRASEAWCLLKTDWLEEVKEEKPLDLDYIITKLYEDKNNFHAWRYTTLKGDVLIIRTDKELEYIENALNNQRIKFKLNANY